MKKTIACLANVYHKDVCITIGKKYTSRILSVIGRIRCEGGGKILFSKINEK